MLRGELSRAQRVEAVAVVHHRPQRVVVPGEADHLPHAARVAFAVLLLLTELVLVEPPDAAVFLEQRTRILARPLRWSIPRLTRVGRRADVDVQAAATVERETFLGVLPPVGQTIDDDFRCTRRLQLARRHLVADHGRRRREVQESVAHADTGGAARTKRLARIHLAVAVRVAQRDNAPIAAARAASLEADEQIAG